MIDVIIVGHVMMMMMMMAVNAVFDAAVDAERHGIDHHGVVVVSGPHHRRRHAVQRDIPAFGRDKRSLRSFRRCDGAMIASRRQKRRR